MATPEKNRSKITLPFVLAAILIFVVTTSFPENGVSTRAHSMLRTSSASITTNSSSTIQIESTRPANRKRPANKLSRIGIVTHGRWMEVDEELHRRSVVPQYINKECYARKHGFDNIFGTHHVDQHNVLFSRVLMGQEWLKHYDWILVSDADYFFSNFSRSLRDYTDYLDELGVDVFVPQTYCGHPVRGPKLSKNKFNGAFDTYTIMIKNSPVGRHLLESWAQSKYYCPSAKKPEQTRLFLVLGRLLMEYHKEPVTPLTDCSVHCTNDPEDFFNSTSGIIKCLKSALERHGHRQGHDGAFGYPPDPPIAWSNGPCGGEEAPGTDVGLGFNMNLHSSFVEAPLHAWNGVGIHMKPGGFANSVRSKLSRDKWEWQTPNHVLSDRSHANTSMLEHNNRQTGGPEVDACFDELQKLSDSDVLKMQDKQFRTVDARRIERMEHMRADLVNRVESDTSVG